MNVHTIGDTVSRETILVPLDGSGASEAALPLAAMLARASSATVHIVGATLVVISTHGRTGLSRLWLGSTADWLMRFLPVPVLAVRPRDEPWSRAPSLEHVLVALDGSARAEAVLPAALRVGRMIGSRYTLLQVVPTSVRELVSYATRSFPPIRDERRTMALLRAAKRRLDDVAAAMRRHLGGRSVTVEVVADDYVADAILERAQRDDVGLIALSSRGRGASRLLVGSVADKVMRGFTGALLVLGPVAAQELDIDDVPISEESVAGAR